MAATFSVLPLSASLTPRRRGRKKRPSQLDSIEYFKQNVTSVPIHIPILVIANFRDQFDAWKISPAELQSLIDDYSQLPSLPESESHDPPQPAELLSELSSFGTMLGELYEGRRRVIKLIETSMLEKFGLHVGDDDSRHDVQSLYLFLCVPFFIFELIQLRTQIIVCVRLVSHPRWHCSNCAKPMKRSRTT